MMWRTFLSFEKISDPNCKPNPTRRARPKPSTKPICKIKCFFMESKIMAYQKDEKKMAKWQSFWQRLMIYKGNTDL